MRLDRGKTTPDHGNLAGKEIIDGGGRRTIGHVHNVDIGERVEQQQREMMRRAYARRPGGKLAGLLLRERDQFTDAVGQERKPARTTIASMLQLSRTAQSP